MKIIIDLLKYFGILLFNAPCIRLSAMSGVYNYFIIHLNHLDYFMFVCVFCDFVYLYEMF